MDSLMTASDELDRVDRYVEGVVHRLEKEIKNLFLAEADLATERPQDREKRERKMKDMPFIGPSNEPAEKYLTKFSWDQARYRITTPVPELIKEIQDSVQRMDEELKVKQMDYSQIRSAMTTVSRKKDGNLANKSLVDVVQKKHVVSSAHLDTVFCAVPRSGVQEFMQNYEHWGKVPAAEHPAKFKREFLLNRIEDLDKEDPGYEEEKKRLMEKQLEKQVSRALSRALSRSLSQGISA